MEITVAHLNIVLFFFSIFFMGVTMSRKRGGTISELFGYGFTASAWLLFVPVGLLSINLIFNLVSLSALRSATLFGFLLASFGLAWFYQISKSRQKRSTHQRLQIYFSSEFFKEAFVLGSLFGYGLWCLLSIRLNYSGFISTLLSPQTYAQGLSSSYPQFVDEWYAVAFSKFTLIHSEMPFVDPVSFSKQFFLNIQWLFHNFNSSIFMLLDLDPLTSYVYVGLGINLGICVLIYLIQRQLGIDRFSSFFASALALHLTHGSNLPTLWSYLPIHLGLFTFLSGVLCLLMQAYPLLLVFWILSFFIYPPLALFFFPAFFLERKRIAQQKTKIIFLLAITILIFSSILFYYWRPGDEGSGFWSYIFNRMFFQKHSPNIYDSLNPFWIVSPAILFLALIGVRQIWSRSKYIGIVLIQGALLWGVYYFSSFRFIIDYPRVVLLVGLLLSVVAGFGGAKVIESLKGYKNFLVIPGCLYLLWFGFKFTENNRWEKLTVSHVVDPSQKLSPRPPFNLILQPDDLRIGKELSGHFLVSDPWKSTVLAVTVGAVPVFLKSGTISGRVSLSYEDFLKDPCRHLARYWRISFYVYLPETLGFNCPNLFRKDKSKEGFILYEHIGRK